MEQLQHFDFKGLAVSVIDKAGEIWFKAQNVCDALKIQNTSDAMKGLDKYEMTGFNLVSQSGETNFISEPGLYHLLNDFRKPETKPFQYWVNHEVLPILKKTAMKTMDERQSLIACMSLMAVAAENTEKLKRVTQQQAQKIIELDEKVESQITLDHGEQRRLQKAVAHRVYALEVDKGEQRKLFQEIYRELKKRFAVASYKDILRRELQDAIRCVEAYKPKRFA
ncbi:BRO family protein [Sporolactobacillus pectinivorans]|uniref:BRO family protein n=1 Tax=Sporolactobacillus pectinivorans TaxID=1591408 RepID=UPI000C261792|nr:BRO family protein [Sporolactobacillus pectinivorans]